MNSFSQEFARIAKVVENKNSPYLQRRIDDAIREWGISLHIKSEIVQYILDYRHRFLEIDNLIQYIHDNYLDKNNITKFFQKQLFQYIESILNKSTIGYQPDNIKIIVILAFVITAVGNFLYLLKSPEESTFREVSSQRLKQNKNSNTAFYSLPPITQKQENRKPKKEQVLTLVISASKSFFINSLHNKINIDLEDCEYLYEGTRYLYQVDQSEFKFLDTTRFEVQPGTESEYDVYLVQLTLKQEDERFNPDVNQIERYDAFQNLPESVTDVKISPRLTMDAYSELDVYVR
ncbi:MAG: hypothetical protein ACLFT0_05995 [Spirulinaceae cyanobacterium]